MVTHPVLSHFIEKRYLLLCWFLVLLGIAFRLTMFFQNRNLIIDEANVVRNIYERDMLGLLKPLSYEQYAPPVYLWSLELFSHIFGYSEQAMRLSALLCGIGAIFAFWWLLRKTLPENSYWLPLGLLCFAPILVKYSAEVKQYIPDAFVAIGLVCMALKINLFETTKKQFVLHWIILGSIAIWSSQPSVFTLAAVGFYYAAQCAVEKRWNLIGWLIPVGLVWLAQFGLYYEVILKAQINSDYLQNYHREYFLFATPANKEEWHHNWIRIKEVLNNTAGFNQYSMYYCIAFILLGAISLLRKSVPLFLLLFLPVGLTLLAAALNQFSLIERVIIFVLPFTMILAGYGFAALMSIRLSFVDLKAVFFLLGAFMLNEYHLRQLFQEKYYFQELTVGLDYIIDKGGKGEELYVDCASRDTYIYYTQIHPGREKYAPLKGAYLFNWSDDNFPEVARNVRTARSFFIFTGGGEDLRNRHLNEVREVLNQTDAFEFVYCYVFTFQKK